MSKVIGIVVFDEVVAVEVLGYVSVFSLAGRRGLLEDVKILFIGVDSKPSVRTVEGLNWAVDCTISDDLKLDVLFVPGAYDVSELLQHEGLQKFIQQQSESSEWVGSVCAGAFLLGNAGVLDGRQATTWFGGEGDLQAQFPQIEVVFDKPVVVDNRRITANGGAVSFGAALTMLAQLTSVQDAHTIYEALGLDRLGDWVAIEAGMLN